MNLQDAPLILVVWKDASTAPSWITQRQVKEHVVPLCYTIGWKVHETKEFIAVAQTVGNKTKQADEEDMPGNLWYVPKNMVVKIVKLKTGKL